MSKISDLLSKTGSTPTADSSVNDTALRTTPFAWRDHDGTYVGHDGSVWYYRSYPVEPISTNWEDPGALISYGKNLETALIEIGEMSKDGVAGFGTDLREIHLVSITSEREARPPAGLSPALRDYQEQAFGFTIPVKAFFVGVRLRAAGGGANEPASFVASLKDFVTSALGESVPDLERYAQDKATITNILARSNCKSPTLEERNLLESWYNLGRGTDAVIIAERDSLQIDDVDRLEMASVREFGQMHNTAPNYQWAFAAETHRDSARIVSVRGELLPSEAARKLARKSQRQIRAQIEEEAETGDIERVEYSDTMHLAGVIEDHFINSSEPLLQNASIIMARRAQTSADTYVDHLRTKLNIHVEPLKHRQLSALDETLPCSRVRHNPFTHYLSVGMVAYAGMHGFSKLGDRTGAFVGLTDPNLTTCFLDPLAAPAANAPASMAILGDTGSGKTWLAQMLASQFAFGGYPTIMVNPKGEDSLAALVQFVGGRLVSMSKMESASGAFDPCRYARTPQEAAQLLVDHILSSFNELDERDEVNLMAGISAGIEAGARCGLQALRYVEDRELQLKIGKVAKTQPLFALGFGTKPLPRLDLGEDNNLTLIEFDRKLELPTPGQAPESLTQRLALSAVQLITRASITMLAARSRELLPDGRLRGGVFVLDEAWTFLGHNVGRSMLETLGREGRSLGLLPIFVTQKVTDITEAGLEGMISRVFAMKLTDKAEAAAALRLCGLEETQGRLDWLADAGAKNVKEHGFDRWSMAIHKDLNSRRSALLIGPTPGPAKDAFTTNPEERAAIMRRLGTTLDDAINGG